MRVLMQVRPDWRELPGGDLVQLQRWTVWLRRLGHHVTVSDAAAPNLRGVDLAHFHNLARAYALWPAWEHCRRAGMPCVLTPLFWPTEEYECQGRPGWSGTMARWLPRDWRERLKSAARSVRATSQRHGLLREMWLGSEQLNRRFGQGFDGLIVNSHAEASELARLLPAMPPAHFVPSGVDALYWSPDTKLWATERQPVLPGQEPPADDDELAKAAKPANSNERRGVLCVARFDPQKGQHRLIEALQSLGVPLTLAGPDNPNYPGYRALCQRLAGPNVTILSRRTSGQLKALYSSCQVFALCSWYEISALSGLEAACCGARVVMTSRGGWRDYGADLAWYADPADLGSIRNAVEAAMISPWTPPLRNRIVGHFTWEHSARALVRAYEDVLAAHSAAFRAA
jgi:glycosyltransferase involved in cell wall biosynthesis